MKMVKKGINMKEEKYEGIKVSTYKGRYGDSLMIELNNNEYAYSIQKFGSIDEGKHDCLTGYNNIRYDKIFSLLNTIKNRKTLETLLENCVRQLKDENVIEIIIFNENDEDYGLAIKCKKLEKR